MVIVAAPKGFDPTVKFTATGLSLKVEEGRANTTGTRGTSTTVPLPVLVIKSAERD